MSSVVTIASVPAIDGDWGFYTRKALQSYLAKGA